jgi:hypothetical protein
VEAAAVAAAVEAAAVEAAAPIDRRPHAHTDIRSAPTPI